MSNGNVLEVPSVEFAGFYYPEILRELLAFFRRNLVELGLTDENVFEVHVQLARAFSLVGHLNNTRLDVVANELLWESASLLESMKRLLRLIGVQLNSATPAQVDLLLTLSGPLTADIAGFIPELAEFSTESTPPIAFEDLDGLDVDQSDILSHAFGLEQEKSGTGSVATASPDIFTRTAGDSFVAGDVNKHIFIPTGLSNNGGEFRITEFIDTDNVRVVRVPGSTSPGFQDESGLAWTLKAFTADGVPNVNSAGPAFTPWADVVAGDFLFIGHEQILWDLIAIELDTLASGITGVFEYFDDQRSIFNPASVVDNLDGTLTLNCNPLLSTTDRAGAEIIVTYLPTGVQERVASVFGTENTITTQTYFGQTVPSTDPTDYSITADWIPLENQVDGSSGFTQDGSVTYDLPYNLERSWLKTEVNLIDGYWIRFRVIGVSTPTEPVFDRLRIDGATQYLVRRATQGETIGPQTLGSSDGTASQTFSLPETPFLDETELIEVDEGGGGTFVPYTRVGNFLNSQATSRHYTIDTDAEDRATITFGDGESGKIPPTGTDNVRGTYRTGGDIDGNVGPNEVVVNSDGIIGVASVSNPRAASGWRIKDGGTDEDIERLRREAPAALRTRDRAINETDIPSLAINEFLNADGIKPVARAFAVEEGLGVKTVKLLVVGVGGTTLTSDERSDLDDFFNGDRNASPPIEGKLLLNHQLTSFNFTPQTVNVQATVVWPGGNAESVRSALLSLLTPLALEDDGVTYVWDFGGNVSLSRVYSEIHAVDPNIEDVSTLLLNGVAASFALGTSGLPVSTAAGIVINISET